MCIDIYYTITRIPTPYVVSCIAQKRYCLSLVLKPLPVKLCIMLRCAMIIARIQCGPHTVVARHSSYRY